MIIPPSSTQSCLYSSGRRYLIWCNSLAEPYVHTTWQRFKCHVAHTHGALKSACFLEPRFVAFYAEASSGPRSLFLSAAVTSVQARSVSF